MSVIQHIISAAGACLLAFGACGAQAQGRPQQISDQLDYVGLMSSGNGFRESHARTVASMSPGRVERHSLMLQEGRAYLLAAVCDEACGDVDLEVYDERGARVGVDVGPAELALIELRPRWSGPFLAHVRLRGCGGGGCFYGIGVFVR